MSRDKRRAGRALAGLTLGLAALVTSPIPTLGQATEAAPLPQGGTALEPGRYVSSVVGPTIEFRVDDGWIAGRATDGPIFTLERSGLPGTVLSITRFDGDAFVDSCDPTSLTRVDVTVPRLIEIIAGNPYLNPEVPSLIDVAGFQGLQLDVATPVYQECALPYLLIWALPMAEGGEFVQVADQQSRFIALDVDGDVIVIAIESFPGVPFGGLLDASMDLVESMRIEPGPYSPPEPSASPEPGESPAPSPTAAAPESAASPSHSPTPSTGADGTA